MAGVTTLDEAVARFLENGSDFGYGDGDGYGDGYGYGYGDGDGYGDGYGDGSGYGDGYGSGYGSGDGYGSGYGSGFGDGSGSGSGSGACDVDGDGFGFGDSDGIKTFCDEPVQSIDGISTIIRSVHGNVAMGAILQMDLTLKKCYIVKGEGYFAHGDTLTAAMEALHDKLFEDMPEEERIDAFVEEFKAGVKYPAKLFYEWHHRLTGSCEMGRQSFAKDHNIDVEADQMTREEFAELTKDAYGGEVIRHLMERF